MLEDRYTRTPIYRESIDDIVGLVHLKDLVSLVRNGGTQRAGNRQARAPRPRAQTDPPAAHRHAARAVPHGGGEGRVRRHPGPRHAGGHPRGDRRRDPRRVRHRGVADDPPHQRRGLRSDGPRHRARLQPREAAGTSRPNAATRSAASSSTRSAARRGVARRCASATTRSRCSTCPEAASSACACRKHRRRKSPPA